MKGFQAFLKKIMDYEYVPKRRKRAKNKLLERLENRLINGLKKELKRKQKPRRKAIKVFLSDL